MKLKDKKDFKKVLSSKLQIKDIQYHSQRLWFTANGILNSGEKVFLKAAVIEEGKVRLQKDWDNLEKIMILIPEELKENIAKGVEQISKDTWLINLYQHCDGRPISNFKKDPRQQAFNYAVGWISKLGLTTKTKDTNNQFGYHVLSHGDFTVNNLLWDQDREKLSIVDWEMMDEEGHLMYDLCDLVVSNWLTTLKGKLTIGLRSAIHANENIFRQYLNELQIKEEIRTPLTVNFFQVAAKREAILDSKQIENTSYHRLLKKLKYDQ